mgnify:CR=1 FL=1
MAIRAKLTTEEEIAARKAASPSSAPTGSKRVVSEEEKATRKERVAKAKDALARADLPYTLDYMDVAVLSPLDRQFLVERQLVSRAGACANGRVVSGVCDAGAWHAA